jgi:hypothetical protein
VLNSGNSIMIAHSNAAPAFKDLRNAALAEWRQLLAA